MNSSRHEQAAARTQAWRDLAALLNPAGGCACPIASGRALAWHRIYAVAAGQWVAPTLYAVLAPTPRWAAVPEEVQQALAELHRLNAARNAHLRQVLRQTIQHLNSAGLEPLLLKGALALLPGQYPHAGARMLGDLDIAIYNASAEEANTVLRAKGYRGVDERSDLRMYDRMHHLEPLADPTGSVSIELHREVLAYEVPSGALPLATVCKHATPLNWEGLKLWVPCAAHRLLHNALHDAVVDDGYRSGARSLRQLLEFALLRRHEDLPPEDWRSLMAHTAGLNLGDAFAAHLQTCGDLFDQALPQGLALNLDAQRATARFWAWIGKPQWWAAYKLARRVKGLAKNSITPYWYPSKWRQLRRFWAARG